ncbi:hypothetical protein EVAR_17467_1 [Eumeta japonica]|uniref:Uncharacterized protein n=1 Tax=Eumeta variegata TaxID=151549 RepID=A0A4C1VCD3_EUMVA|nr:hypothetical protein EVAR_17467_1 [Eumeta japonica]
MKVNCEGLRAVDQHTRLSTEGRPLNSYGPNLLNLYGAAPSLVRHSNPHAPQASGVLRWPRPAAWPGVPRTQAFTHLAMQITPYPFPCGHDPAGLLQKAYQDNIEGKWRFGVAFLFTSQVRISRAEPAAARRRCERDGYIFKSRRGRRERRDRTAVPSQFDFLCVRKTLKRLMFGKLELKKLMVKYISIQNRRCGPPPVQRGPRIFFDPSTPPSSGFGGVRGGRSVGRADTKLTILRGLKKGLCRDIGLREIQSVSAISGRSSLVDAFHRTEARRVPLEASIERRRGSGNDNQKEIEYGRFLSQTNLNDGKSNDLCQSWQWGCCSKYHMLVIRYDGAVVVKKVTIAFVGLRKKKNNRTKRTNISNKGLHRRPQTTIASNLFRLANAIVATWKPNGRGPHLRVSEAISNALSNCLSGVGADDALTHPLCRPAIN